jgi:hypothetical protein
MVAQKQILHYELREFSLTIENDCRLPRVMGIPLEEETKELKEKEKN